jgi:hypothetical protein
MGGIKPRGAEYEGNGVLRGKLFGQQAVEI